MNRNSIAPIVLAQLLVAASACGGSEGAPEAIARQPPPAPEATPDSTPVASFGPGSFGERAILGYVNSSVSEATLASGELSDSSAALLVSRRNGADGLPGTLDDRPYTSASDLLSLPDVYEATLEALYWEALKRGYVPRESQVIFSPQALEHGHTAAIVQRIDEARRTIDIAMFSHSELDTARALVRAAQRGVRVRYLLDDVRRDPQRDGAGSFLATLEGTAQAPTGSDVRYTTPGVHHKFVIVDGPADSAEAARWARVSVSSGNLSFTAASHADEATLFFSDEPELALRLQREFETLWRSSSDHRPTELSPKRDEPEAHYLPRAEDIVDAPDLDVLFTSENFARDGSGAWRLARHHGVGNQLAQLIRGARVSVHVAARTLRSRPVAEALIAAAKEHPGLDIRVLLDQRDTISQRAQALQVQRRAACLADPPADGEQRSICSDAGFGYALELERAGAQVRFKTYAWDYEPLAGEPLHHKYLLVDGTTLAVGSYNLSYSAEHQHFEDLVILRGERFRELTSAFEANFASLWELGRDRFLPELIERTRHAQQVPLVFADATGLGPMTLTRREAGDLRGAIWLACGLGQVGAPTGPSGTDEEANPGRDGPTLCARRSTYVPAR